jgi:hypothetical protein
MKRRLFAFTLALSALAVATAVFGAPRDGTPESTAPVRLRALTSPETLQTRDPEGEHWWDGFGPSGAGLDGAPNAVALYRGNLVIAGGSGLFQWDGSSWSLVGSGSAEAVHALNVYNSRLIVAGMFGAVGGVQANSIAQWDGQYWSPMGAGMWRCRASSSF